MLYALYYSSKSSESLLQHMSHSESESCFLRFSFFSKIKGCLRQLRIKKMQIKKGKNISLKVEFQYHLFLKLFETREVKQCWQSDSVLKVTT